jgi:2-methylisocitrate lyase-like PEP mutase family enzyme
VSPMSNRKRLRELLAAPDAVIAPGVYDCLTARVAERAGAQAIIVTGAGVAASVLGTPDVGLMTMTEVVTQTRNIVRSVEVPVVADCDTGYGNPINVQRTIREFESAGVSALFMEDQVSPKRCGHFSGKQIISAEDMVQKIRAAVDARVDPDLLLIARTDARAVDGPEEAIRRSRMYVEAGAEMIFVEAPHTVDELRLIGQELKPLGVPLMVNLVEGGRTPLVPVSELTEMGFSFVSFSGSMQKTAIAAMQPLVETLLRTGEVTEFYPDAMISLDERSEILGLPHFFELEKRYATP